MVGEYTVKRREQIGKSEVQELSYLMTLRDTFIDDIWGSHLEGHEAMVSDVGGHVEEMYSILSTHYTNACYGPVHC